MCGDCASQAAHDRARDEAAMALWVNEGIHAIEHYLAGWAAFSEWLTVHPPV